MRAAIYARFSTNLQSCASTDDQHRLCRELAQRNGWSVTAAFSDAAISGATMLRAGLQDVLAAARAGEIDVVIAEALDRLSRDQEDVAAIFKRLSFAGVSLVTLSEGEISPLHVGLKGTMNALFLKDLADKTRRGMRGRIEAGKSVAGLAYGYEVTAVGERRIVEAEAAIVRRIFADYANGMSPRAIAAALNREKIAGPNGRVWGQSTIIGNRLRGNGILNNEAYAGRLVWNRQRFVKDPETRRRQARMNPREQWIVVEAPELRIVDAALWDAVKARQGAYEHRPLAERRRAQHLLSGKVKCGCCGGGMSAVGKDLLGCSAARDRGTCSNRATIRRGEVEQRILAALEHEILRDDLFVEFCAEYTREMNRLTMERKTSERGLAAERAKIERQLDKLVEALKDGVPASRVKDEMVALEGRAAELDRKIAAAKAPTPYLHPNMAAVYRARVAALRDGITAPGSAGHAAREAVRTLIERVIVTPAGADEMVGTARGPRIELAGDLANILNAALTPKNQTPAISGGRSASLVAGTCAWLCRPGEFGLFRAVA